MSLVHAVFILSPLVPLWGVFWFLVCAFSVLSSGLDHQGECVAGEGGMQCRSNFEEAASSNPLLSVVSPAHRQEFHKGNVPVECELASLPATANVCWKLVADPDCYGLWTDEGKASQARRALAKDQPYHGCSHPPVSGTMKLTSSCWLFQFDLIAFGKVKETEFRSINVVAVDELVDETYPNVPRIPGGEISVWKTAAANRGMGMTLEFGLGRSTIYLSRSVAETTSSSEEILHSFDSLQGLPEKWRDGFEKGKFSLDGKIPPSVVELPNAQIHEGWVNETLPRFLDSNPIEPVGLLVMDFCVEHSTAFVLDQLACRLNKGSIVLFANFFNYPNWIETSGERSAWLSAVDRWGIQFETTGFYATFFMLQITRRPTQCPGSGGENRNENDLDAVVHDWTTMKLSKFKQLLQENEAYREELVRELEDIIAVDPTHGEALGYLAFLLTRDISRIADMLDYARRALLVQHRMPDPGSDPVAMLTSLHKNPSFEGKFMRQVRKHRLYHDLEQIRYLRKKDRLPRKLTDSAIAAYKEILSQFPDASRGDMLTLSWEQWGTIGPFFNRALHVPVVSRVKDGALNPEINFTAVEAAYNNSNPHVVVVDDFLSNEAISKLLRYYREATIYYDTQHYSYLGSYLTDGLGNPVLAQIIEEVTEKMRPILCDRHLRQAWVYKYDDTKVQKGIDIHADKAAVNFNVWLGENESLDPDRGGLVVYTARAPANSGFEFYNTSPLPREAAQLLEQSGYKNITVPYKQNRMIMFDSRLFHVSDIAGWKPGYEKRRINLTLLFGKAESTCESPDQSLLGT